MKFKQVPEYDNHNHALSIEQAEFFKNSVVRDSHNRLMVCYHGTRFYGFDEFDPLGMESGFSYFTTNYGYADVYANDDFYDEDEDTTGIYRCYLNITNPINLGDIEQPIFKEGGFYIQIEGKYVERDDAHLTDNDFTEDFLRLAKLVHMKPIDLYKAPRFIDDNALYEIVRRPEFADIIVKQGYDGIITGEYKGEAACYGIPYTRNN